MVSRTFSRSVFAIANVCGLCEQPREFSDKDALLIGWQNVANHIPQCVEEFMEDRPLSVSNTSSVFRSSDSGAGRDCCQDSVRSGRLNCPSFLSHDRICIERWETRDLKLELSVHSPAPQRVVEVVEVMRNIFLESRRNVDLATFVCQMQKRRSSMGSCYPRYVFGNVSEAG